MGMYREEKENRQESDGDVGAGEKEGEEDRSRGVWITSIQK